MFRIIQPFFRYMMRDKDILYVLCPYSIGDFLIVGGLCHALLKKKRKKTCVLIINERYVYSGSIDFVGVMEVKYFPEVLLHLARQYAYVTREYETDNYIHGYFHSPQDLKYWDAVHAWNPNLSFADRWKENVFGLPLDTEVIPPIIPPPLTFKSNDCMELIFWTKSAR